MHSADDFAMCSGDFSGNVDGIYRGYGIGQRNLEGRMLLWFCLDKELCVHNTWLR